MPTVLKSGSLNLLEPSGPVQACNEIALPFLPGFRTQNGPARSLVTILTELSRPMTNERWQNLKIQTPQVPKLAFGHDPDTLRSTSRHQALLPKPAPLV